MIKVKIKGAHDIVVSNDNDNLVAGEEQAVIKTISNGICGSDMHRYSGKQKIEKPDNITGHEFGGIIKEVNSRKRPELTAGMKVTVNPVTGCGKCIYCEGGRKDLCDKLDFLGGMAEEVVVPVDNIIPLGSDFDMNYSSMLEPAAVAEHAAENLKGKNIIIIGVGTIGLIEQQIAAGCDNNVMTIDISEFNLDMSRKLGSAFALKYSEVDEMLNKVRTFFKDENVDCVIDNVSADSTIDFSIRAVKHGGEVRMIGVNWGSLKFKFMTVLLGQIVLRPIHIYTDKHFTTAIEHIKNGIIRLQPLVTKVFSLSEAKEAFEFKYSQPSVKVLLLNEK